MSTPDFEFDASRESNELAEQVTPDRFREWYNERQYRENIERGQSYFNGPGSIPEPERHNPSQLLQCKRKIFYRQTNAPEEEPDPDGIFWIGTHFEEELIHPFLRTVAEPEAYIQNSIWIDYSVETDAGELQIKGSTDPVIVDADAIPIVPTEIKTKSSINNLTEPNQHHRAQLHAYLVGLSEKFERDVSDGILIYGSREDLELKVFHVTFDEEFWEEVVLEWATEHTQYRIDDELPPSEAKYDWECEFCSYQERCGQGDLMYENGGPTGLLPGYTDYPREKLIEYLEAHEQAKLTPSLGHQYPSLADEYGVFEWHCSACATKWAWDEPDWNSGLAKLPRCPNCEDNNRISLLSGPKPENQLDSYG